MFELSVQSALFILATAYLIGLLGVVFIYLKYKDSHDGLYALVLFYVLSFIGISLIIYREYLPVFISIIVANTVLVVGRLWLIKGLYTLYNYDYKKQYANILLILYVAGFVYFYYFFESVTARILIYTGSALLLHAILTYKLLKDTNKLKYDIMVPVNVLLIVNFVVRFVRAAVIKSPSNNFFDLYSDSLSLVTIGLLSLIMVAAVYSVIANKINNSLAETNDRERLYSSVYYSSPIPIIIGEDDGGVIHANQSLLDMVGRDLNEILGVGWKGFCRDEARLRIEKLLSNLSLGESVTTYDTEIILEDKTIPVEMTFKRSDIENRFEVYLVDLTEKREFLDKLEKINLEQQSVLDNIPGFAYKCKNDDYWTMEVLSNSFESITGYSRDDILDNSRRSFNDLILPEHQQKVKDDWEIAVREKTKYVGEYQMRKADGSIFWVWEQGQAEYDTTGNVIHLIGFISDISYRKDVEDALEFLSYHDSMTGLFNRRYIEAELSRVDVKRNYPISLVKLDIDNLKFANDVFGHSYGDEIIKRVAVILKETLREDEIVGRMGGDEFLIVLPNTSELQAQNIVDRLHIRFDNAQMKTTLSVSIGVASKVEDHDIKITQTLAEERMYSNKVYKKPMISENSVKVLLNLLYEKKPEEERIVDKVVEITRDMCKHLSFSVLRTDKVVKASRLSRVGLVSDIETGLEGCEYRTEDTYRVVKAIPQHEDVANILMNICEHYDGQGHPRGIEKDSISVDTQIISLALFIVVNGYDAYEPEALVELLEKNSGRWFNPLLVQEYKRMVL